MPSALIILAQKNYQDAEYAETRRGLEDAGFIIVIGSSSAGTCTGSLGASEQATVALKDVDVTVYDRVAFVGGPGASVFAEDPEALRIVCETVARGKPLGAICIAPTILARAGILKGKKATVWDRNGEQAGILTEEGATYTGEDVTQDGSILTANGPHAAEEFGRRLGML